MHHAGQPDSVQGTGPENMTAEPERRLADSTVSPRKTPEKEEDCLHSLSLQ